MFTRPIVMLAAAAILSMAFGGNGYADISCHAVCPAPSNVQCDAKGAGLKAAGPKGVQCLFEKEIKSARCTDGTVTTTCDCAKDVCTTK